MHVNIRSEEVSAARAELVEKEADGVKYVGVRVVIGEVDAVTLEADATITLWQVDDARSKSIAKLLIQGANLLEKRAEKIRAAKVKAKTDKLTKPAKVSKRAVTEDADAEA